MNFGHKEGNPHKTQMQMNESGDIDKVSPGLVREYLYVKGLGNSLRALNDESSFDLLESLGEIRLRIPKQLGVENIMRINKKSGSRETSFKSILELVVNFLTSDDSRVQSEGGGGGGTIKKTKKASQKELNQCQEGKNKEILPRLSSHSTHYLHINRGNVKSTAPASAVPSSIVKCRISELNNQEVEKGPSNIVVGRAKVGESSQPRKLKIISDSQKSFDKKMEEEKLLTSRANGISSIKSNWFESSNQSNANRHLNQNEEPNKPEKVNTKEEVFSKLSLNNSAMKPSKVEKEIKTCLFSDDIEFEDLEFEEMLRKEEGRIYEEIQMERFNKNLTSQNCNPCKGGSRPIGKMRNATRTLGVKDWKSLKMCILGPNGTFSEGWLRQGLQFDVNIPCGLAQLKGGPCGVLAVVQALLLQKLIFEYQIESLDKLTNAQYISKKRQAALESSIVDILQRCGKRSENSFETSIIFSNLSAGDEYRVFEDLDEMKEFLHTTIENMDCIGLVYSAVMSRGIDNIQCDMDFPDSSLLGQHGYCSQELVNLLLTGKATSNVFDGEINLDNKVLKGMDKRCDIGYLSLYEHYNSCQVGSFLKNPKYPLFILCSESHFSLLFSTQLNATEQCEFDLIYYDGLARQKKLIRLTICTDILENGEDFGRISLLDLQSGKQPNKNPDQVKNSGDEDMVPPIEKCIRTKWKNARIDWNGSEPIL